MQVCNIEELKNKISEEEFEEIYQEIEKRLEASIEFVEEDYSKKLDEIAKERKEKLQNLIDNLKVNIDTNYFQNNVIINIEKLGYTTSAKINVNPQKTLNNNVEVNENILNKDDSEEQLHE